MACFTCHLARLRNAVPRWSSISTAGRRYRRARPVFDAAQQYLLARGYAILDLNFRGSIGYGKRFTLLDNRRLRPNAVRDMGAAVDWLAQSNRPVDASKGRRDGSLVRRHMTNAALTQLPDKFVAGVSLVGVSNWVTALEGASPELKASDRIEYGNIDDPADRDFFKEISPLTHVKNVRAPCSSYTARMILVIPPRSPINLSAPCESAAVTSSTYVFRTRT